MSALVAAAAAANPINADVLAQTQYTFAGQCAPNDCSGVATGLLTLSGYTAGNLVNPTQFVSFVYTSSVYPGGITFTSADSDITARIPTVLPAAVFVAIGSASLQFTSSTDGTWSLAGFDMGTNGTWSTAAAQAPAASPEPASMMLMGLGLTGLAALGRLISSRVP